MSIYFNSCTLATNATMGNNYYIIIHLVNWLKGVLILSTNHI